MKSDYDIKTKESLEGAVEELRLLEIKQEHEFADKNIARINVLRVKVFAIKNRGVCNGGFAETHKLPKFNK